MDTGPRANDTGALDSGVADAGVSDARIIDAGDPDIVDARVPDAGHFMDAAPRDSGTVNTSCNGPGDTWRTMSSVGAPSPRYWQSAVWTGTEVMIWGGIGSGTYKNDGALYNPTTDTWRAVPTAGAPSGRLDTVIAWTGTEVLVWGGRAGGGGGYADGAAFNPSTMRWRAMPTANGPTPAAQPESAWTGTEFVVWGDDTVVGARYNPSTNTWTQMSTTGAPTPRDTFVMTAMNGEVAVWAGRACGGGQCPYVANGARYNLGSNSWTPMSTTNAPTGAAWGTGVFTGTELLVFGGRTCGTVSPACDITAGASYNPANDTWTPLETAGEPAARHNHTAVWTGSRMIIWGGGSAQLNTGGVYNPSSFSWTPTSVQGAPSGRRLHSGVWTNAGLVVWGGVANGIPTNDGAGDGAVYCPPTPLP